MKHLAFHRNLRVHPRDVDHVDYAESFIKQDGEEKGVYTPVSAFFTLVSMVTFVTELASSLAVCYLLFSEDPRWWFVMTLTPLIASLITVNAFSMRWYIHDQKEKQEPCVHASISHWILRIIFHSVLLGPVIRYLELFLYGVHSRDVLDPLRREYQILVFQEDRDTSFLALIGSFTKSAPMVVLQLYILLQNRSVDFSANKVQWVNICVSIVGLALALTSYHRALRRSLRTKKNMTPSGSAMQFISHLLIIGCRTFALAAFASEFGLWVFFVCAVHWILMISWLILKRTSFCSADDGEPRICDELSFNAVVGIIYIFCFLNVKDEPTRWKYTLYYFLALTENMIIISLWYTSPTLPAVWYRLHMILGVVISFFAGIVTLGIYYAFLHPNKINKRSMLINLPFPTVQ